MRKFTVKDLSIAGMIAALYAILSLAFQPISFGVYQVRIAEALTVLPFLTPAAIPGLFVGCVLANIIGGMGWLDIILGPLITLAAAIMTRGTFHLSRIKGSSLLASVPVLLLWGGAVCLLTDCQPSIKIAIGISLSTLSITLIIIAEEFGPGIKKWKKFLWVVSVIAGIASILVLKNTEDLWSIVVGALSMVAAWMVAMFLARMHFSGDNLNLILAPLPPVLLNAFGVSAYLAPIIGVDYWFAVQMVGIGQLIACYLIGLPLLTLLQRRKLFFY